MTTVLAETPSTDEGTISAHDAEQIERANASGRTPAVFIHGLWLLPSSWDRWVTLFEHVADHVCAVIAKLRTKPAVMGHSFVGQRTPTAASG